jgi:hypothetical protein
LLNALAVSVTINFVRHEIRLGLAGAGFWIDLSIAALERSVALPAHLIEIACGRSSRKSRLYRLENLWQICGNIGGKTVILDHQSSKPAE